MSRAASRCLAVLAGLVLLFSGLAATQSSAAEAGQVSFSNVPIASWRPMGRGYASLVVGDTVYVGGAFTSVSSPDGATSVPRANLAAFSVLTGELITTFRADTGGPVRALAYDGDTLYVGGNFGRIGGVGRSRLAAVDPTSGAVRQGWRADADATVFALHIAAGDLYVGGAFTTLSGVPRARLGAVRLADGQPTPFAPSLDSTVYSIAAPTDASAVYVGGLFTTVNAQPQAYLAKLGPDGSLLAPATWDSLTGPVADLTLADDGTRMGVAVMGTGNQGAWYDTTTGLRYLRTRCDGDGQAVHLVGSTLFSGFHEACEGDTTIRLTSQSTQTGTRDADFRPAFTGFWGVRDIAGDARRLVIAGEFTQISGVAVQGFAIFPAASPEPPVEAPLTTTQVLAPTSLWGWRYEASAPPAGWNSTEATGWNLGAGPLGFGSAGLGTDIDTFPITSTRPLAAYFRTTFAVADASKARRLVLSTVADDGVIVYVNGTEVARSNMPAGPVTYRTYASSRSRTSVANANPYVIEVPASLLRSGVNTIAAETHVAYRATPDLSFHLTATLTTAQ